MPIPEEYIFPDIPKAQLFALLVTVFFYLRIFDLLNIKGCYFYHYVRDG